MNWITFKDRLADSTAKKITFIKEGVQLVPEHYHVTELKQLTIQSVDCGGRKHEDRQVEMQLWLAAKEDDGHRLSKGGVEKIIKVVERQIEFGLLDEFIVEFGMPDSHAVRYQVNLATENDEVLEFHLSEIKSTCKALLTSPDACGCGPGGC